MGPEDSNRKGDRGTMRLVNLFEQLGWNLKSRTDVDAETAEDSDREIGYGIDAYLTYDDPHSRHTHGVILESKAYKWDGVTPAKVEEWFKTLLEKVDNAPDSDHFSNTHNIANEATITNTGILAIWVDDDFSREKFNEYVQKIDVRQKWEVSKIAIFGNQELKRIAQIERDFNHRKEKHGGDLKIFYPDLTNEDGGRVDTLSLHYLVSDYIYANIEGEENTAIVYYFDDMTFEALLFMYKSLRKYQMISNNDKLKIIVPERGIHTEPAEEEFLREFDGEDSSVEIEFVTMESLADLGRYDNL